MPTGFEKLVEHGFGPEKRIERVPVGDLREAVAQYKRLVVLGEPGSGKTTTLWRLVYDYARAAQRTPPPRSPCSFRSAATPVRNPCWPTPRSMPGSWPCICRPISRPGASSCCWTP